MPKVTHTNLQLLIGTYLACYERAFGLKPIVNGVAGRACKLLLQAMPLPEAQETVETAFADKFFVENLKGNMMSLWGRVNEYRKVRPPERKAAQPVEPPKEAISGVSIDDELKVKLGL